MERLAECVAKVTDRVAKLADPVRKVTDDVQRVIDGVAKLTDPVERLPDAVTKVIDGVQRVVDAVTKVADGVGKVTEAVRFIADGLKRLAGDATVLADAMEDDTYSLKELARETGYTTFTIRHYVNRGLLPPAERDGSHSRYGHEHVVWLNAMTRLKEDGTSARIVTQKLEGMSRDEIRAVVFGPPPPPPPPPAVEAPPVLAPPPRSAASVRNAVDALVCVAAEALDASPRVLRPVLAAVFARMKAEEITAEEAARVIGRAAAASTGA